MGRPPLVLPALLVLLVSAVRAGRRLQLDQLEQTRLDEPRLERPRLDEPRLQRPRLDEPRLEDGARRLEDEPPILTEPPRTTGRGSHHRGEADRQQAGSSLSANGCPNVWKRPSAEHQMFLRSRDSTCPRSDPDEEERFFCAPQDPSEERVCVSQARLCDGETDCPCGDDEHAVGCLFALSRKLDKMADKVLQLTAHYRNLSVTVRRMKRQCSTAP